MNNDDKAPTTTREDVASIFTLDGVEMAKGMEVFSVRSTYNESRIERATVIALSRVNRYFILRCAKGCETKVKLTDGCSYGTYSDIPFADLEKAKEKVVADQWTKVKDMRARIATLTTEANAAEIAIPTLDIKII